jgi:hypothetical protein
LSDAFQYSDAVFRGTVLRVEGGALTFTVDKVWKGPVTRQFTVYQSVFVESYTFKPGNVHVLFAHLLTPEERKLRLFHHDDGPIFEIHTCGGPPWQPNPSELDRLARPWRPAP